MANLALVTLGSDAIAADTCPEDVATHVQVGPDPEDADGCVCSKVDLGSTFAVRCDLDPSGTASTAGWIAAVYDPGYGGGGAICDGYEYCAWGNAPGPGDFFCGWDHTWVKDSVTHNLIKVTLEATEHDDVLSFQYSTYDMDVWAASTPMAGVLKGMSGDDIEFGSRADSSGYYTEELFGDDGEDLQCGFDGNDVLTGGDDPDILCAMKGSDANYGAGGHGDYLDYGSTPGGGTDSNDGGPGGLDACNNSTSDPNCETDLSGGLCSP